MGPAQLILQSGICWREKWNNRVRVRLHSVCEGFVQWLISQCVCAHF